MTAAKRISQAGWPMESELFYFVDVTDNWK